MELRDILKNQTLPPTKTATSIDLFRKYIKRNKCRYDHQFHEFKIDFLIVETLGIKNSSMMIFNALAELICLITCDVSIPQYAEYLLSERIIEKFSNILQDDLVKNPGKYSDSIYHVFFCLKNLSSFGHEFVQRIFDVFGVFRFLDLLKFFIQEKSSTDSLIELILILFCNLVLDEEIAIDQYESLLTFFSEMFPEIYIPESPNQSNENLFYITCILRAFAHHPCDSSHSLMFMTFSN